MVSFIKHKGKDMEDRKQTVAIIGTLIAYIQMEQELLFGYLQEQRPNQKLALADSQSAVVNADRNH